MQYPDDKQKNVLLVDKAILIATEEELEEKSPWYTDGTHTFRFVRVPQFLYQMASAHLRSELRKQKPQPPVIRKSGREMTNKADPFYKANLELWKQEWQDLDQEANISTSLFRGIEVQGGIPPIEDWVEEVKDHFHSIGIDYKEAQNTFYHNEDRLHELWFKKFVILRSAPVTEAFGNFQGNRSNDDDDVNLEDDEDAAFAADLFQSDTE